MSTLNTVILVSTVGLSEACSGLTIVAENGRQSCHSDTEVFPEVSQVAPLGDQYISARSCFQQYCASDSIRNFLVGECKNEGYKDCDSLAYHDTYLQDLNTGRYTYDFDGDVDYDEGHAEVTPFSHVSWHNIYNNDGAQVDSQDVTKTIGRSSTSSWTSTQDYTFEEDIKVTISVGIPLTVQEKTDITTKFTQDISSSQTHSETIDQGYGITDHVNVSPHSCDTVCVTENDENTVMPYTLRGDFKPSGIIDWATDGGYVCCYLRKGGSNTCNWGGHGGNGWMAANTPATAASWGNAQGSNKCPHITPSGKNAHIDLPGSWAGGMKISQRVDKLEGPEFNCKTCPGVAVNTSILV